MKSAFLSIVFLSLNCFASAEADSDALSKSFNTTPLGHTDIGYRTVDNVDQEKEKEDRIAEHLACKQNPANCPKSPAPAQKKAAKKGPDGKDINLTEKLF